MMWLVVLTAGVLLVLLALAIASILVFPKRLHPPLTESDLTGLTPQAQIELQDARRKLRNEAMATFMQAVGALVLFISAGIGVYWTARQVDISREGQITERFTRAVDQLGSDNLDVRLGGIHALGRIAKDSPPDQATS
jgi:hypothetical protein